MNYKPEAIVMFAVLGLIQGLLSGIIAFISSYGSYSRFTAISAGKRFRISLEIAVAAFIMGGSVVAVAGALIKFSC